MKHQAVKMCEGVD